MSTQRIIIIGGGFGGVKCAKALSSEPWDEPTEIVLFNRENHLVFSPLLAEVVGSSINPLDVVAPLRHLLPRVFCRTEEVRDIDFTRNEVEFESEDCEVCRMHYDHLVIACGNAANLQVVPGMADYAFPLKTVGDAIALRSHILEELEKAEVCSDRDRRHWHLTFIVVGGGFSGVEVAGEINDLVRSSARYFQNFRDGDVTVKLIQSLDHLLPEISADLRQFAREKLEEAGVQVLLNRSATRIAAEGVALEDDEFVDGGTIVCTIGTSAAPLVGRLDVPKQQDRIVTDRDLRVSGLKNVWAIGDCAWVINGYDRRPSPATGQFAERQGKRCADNIARTIYGFSAKPFRFKPLGQLCSIGGHCAVADLFGGQLAGFFAWFLWRGIYLFKLPTWSRRFQVGFDWAMLTLFPRDLSHLRSQPTDRVARERYEPGDFIFREGEPRLNLYVIEAGEVEVANGRGVSVLGPGSFFGEKALLNGEPRLSSVRARTSVELFVMGRNALPQISPSLVFFRDALAQTLNRS